MEKYALGIDFGTQSVRVIVFDDQGNTIVKYKEAYENPYFSSQNGYAEQWPSYYLDKLFICTNKLVSEHKELVDDLLGASISCFRDSCVVLDENYNLLRPCILWLDQRMAKCEDKLPFTTEAIIRLSTMYETADLNRKRTPANYLKESEKELWGKVRHYWNISTYFNYILTGNPIDSPANYAGHYPINMKKGKWNSPSNFKTHIFGVPISYFPKLIKQGELLGTITEESSKLSGLPVGFKIYAGAGDKSCETLGVGGFDNTLASISYGTSCSIEILTKKYHDSEGFLPAYMSPVTGLYNMEIQVYRGYWMLEWFAKNFASEDLSAAKIAKQAVEEVLNKKMLEIPPGSDGLVLQPYWGPGLKRPLAKGVIIGFSDYHNKYHLYRAIIEGIAFALKEGLLKMEKRRHLGKVNKIRVSGGGASSEAICQITADIFNLPVSRVQTYETASLGAAINVFVSSSYYSSYKQACENMVHQSDEFKPNPQNAKLYQSIYKNVYLKIYPKMKPLNISIRKILKK